MVDKRKIYITVQQLAYLRWSRTDGEHKNIENCTFSWYAMNKPTAEWEIHVQGIRKERERLKRSVDANV